MSSLAIAGASLRRVARDRRALFTIVALPIFVVVIIGFTVRGFSTFPVGIVNPGSGRTGRALVAALRESGDFTLHSYVTADAAATGVARNEVSAAVLIPRDLDRSLQSGRTVAIRVLAEPSNGGQQAAYRAIDAVVERQASRVQAARFATSEQGGTYVANLALATTAQSRVPLVGVASSQVDTSAEILPEGFSYSAPTMLVLFVFINVLTGSATIVETRRLGMYERMAAAPIRRSDIIAGESMSLLVLSLVQAALIVATSAVAFGVSWGDPVAASILVVMWALVAVGAGMLAGTVFRTPEQATILGSTLGLLLAMLGGCMWPLSIVNTIVREIGHATPHAWAVDAFTALIARHATLSGIARDLAVLAGFALGLNALAVWRLRRRLH